VRTIRFVVIDASVLIAICANEPDKYALARAALQQYATAGCALHAPNLAVMETLYILCRKLEAQVLTPAEHATAVLNLTAAMALILTPPGGDASLIARAEQIRSGYSCRRSADSFYIALAEQLTGLGPTELLTFDSGQRSQAATMAPSVTVRLLTP
jgi:predicted nucleic acid-binding protein